MKKEITYCWIGLLCLFSSSLFSRTGSISGKVLDNQGQAVSFANVVLHTTTDSSMVKVEYTNDDGSYQLANIPAGNYWVNVSFVGLTDYNSEPFDLSEGEQKQFPAVQLQAMAENLEEVVVVAQRPLLELKPDKMVFNVEGSANATGSNALELMRKAPGVVVDNNDNISMLGRAGVRVYIDGKPSPLRGDDLAAYLKSMQSTEIDNIELITNPSAKYDAEGNAGIINIRLKKDKNLGANANINLGGSAGQVARYNGSITGNYRNKKFNTFGNYSYYDGRNLNYFNLYREQGGYAYDQRNRQGGDWNSHNFKTGADFFLSKKHTLGFIASGSIGDNTWNNGSRMPISPLGAAPERILIAESINEGDRNNLNFNLNYQFDNGKEVTWNIDADFGRFRNEGTSFQPNLYFDGTETEMLSERIFTTDTPTDIDIYTFKADHERPFLKGKLGAGFKVSQVETDNTFDFFNRIDGDDILDITRSNQFAYTENVNAAYVNYNRQVNKKFGIQLGLRAEQTHSTGDLTSAVPSEEDFVERDYLDFFPSGGITFTPNQKHSLQLSYSRRINRPSYQDLNPFKSQLNELTFEKGNAFLQPEYANNIQLTHSFNYMLNTTISYSHTTDLITRITDIDEDNSEASFITWLNLADQHNYSLSLSAPIPIKDWWSTYTNLTGYYTRNKADYGEGKLVDLDVYAFNIYSQHTFKLPKDFGAELSGWYSSPSLWGGTFEMREMWSLDFGVKKKLFQGRANLKLSVSDIFKTTRFRGESTFGDLFMIASGINDSRRVRVNFSYLFGNAQVKGARKRKTGLSDESSRIKTGN